MRKLIAAVVLVGSLSLSGVAWADPPSEDPTGGNGSHGNPGCRGLANAPSNQGTNLARLILGCG
jgi:hypothetical protein